MLNKTLKNHLNQATRALTSHWAVGPLAGLLLHAVDRGLAHYSPRLPNKAKNQESFRRDEKLFVS
jgi:hypothetical protein